MEKENHFFVEVDSLVRFFFNYLRERGRRKSHSDFCNLYHNERCNKENWVILKEKLISNYVLISINSVSF